MIFVTNLKRTDGTVWDGPRIEAKNWMEADKRAKKVSTQIEGQECIVIGEFISEIDYETGREGQLSAVH